MDEKFLIRVVCGVWAIPLAVTSGILAHSIIPPDEAGDVPGETATALTAIGKTEDARGKVWADQSGEATEKHSSGHHHLADEAPKEPLYESVVNRVGATDLGIALSEPVYRRFRI